MAAKRGNGNGSISQHGKGWRLRWTGVDGKRRSKIVGEMTRAQAQRILDDIIVGLRRGEQPETPTRRVRFDAFAKEYLEAREPLVAVGTYRNWKSLLRGPLQPLERYTLDQLTQKNVDIWWSRQGKHPVNRRNAWFLLWKMMRRAVRWGYLDSWSVLRRVLLGGLLRRAPPRGHPLRPPGAPGDPVRPASCRAPGRYRGPPGTNGKLSRF